MIQAPATADATLERIVQLLLERTTPELVVLFGSRADGTARADSDYDLFLVVTDPGAAEATHRDATAALRDARISADVIVSSASDYQRRQHDPGFLAWPVSRSGTVLYTTGRVPQRAPASSRVREEPPTEGLDMWVERAEGDLREAENSLAAPEPVWDAICFHSHACVEKLLKATIVRSGTYPPRTHDLTDLLRVQPADVAASETLIAACVLLDALLPFARYPDKPPPSPSDARRAVAMAREAQAILSPLLRV